jgi:hypothetical protein
VSIPSVEPNTVFLHVPYGDRFRRQYLAYIVGLTQLGLKPRVTLGIPGGDRRLDRILALIQSCRYSVHEQKSLSDLDGSDANIHGGTVEGVMRELCNAFVRRGPQPGCLK